MQNDSTKDFGDCGAGVSGVIPASDYAENDKPTGYYTFYGETVCP